VVKHKFGGNVFSKDSQKIENNVKVLETIKLNKKLMPRIQLEHLNWDLNKDLFK
jgi:hypothetical protein